MMKNIIRSLLKCLLRIFPLYRGGVRIAQSRYFKKLTSSDEIIVTRLRYGPFIVVNLNDYIGRTIYYWGDYDRKISKLCECLLNRGDCFIDIGANVAEVGLLAASIVGQEGQVHIFEPQANICAYIKKSVELNRFSSVYIHEVALSDKNDRCILSIPSDNTGAAAISRIKNGDGPLVNLRRASEYLKMLKLPAIKVIKIDVEGHEENVIRGAQEFLITNKPTAIIFESHYMHIPFFERKEVIPIKELGYDFFQISQKSLFRVELKKLMNNQLDTGYDFIAIKHNQLESLKTCCIRIT